MRDSYSAAVGLLRMVTHPRAILSADPMDFRAVRIHGEFRDDRAILRRQTERDRPIRHRHHVSDLPGVVAVPKQETLGDLLHIGRGQLAIRLPIDQGKRTPVMVMVPPAMAVRPRVVFPATSPMML